MAGCSAKVVIFGSIYVDMAIRCEEFPDSSKAVGGSEFSNVLTGSGANQATQAALCGCDVYLVGKVGSDIFGKFAKENLSGFGVNCDFVFEAETKSTGLSVSLANRKGHNRTCISKGANRSIRPAELQSQEFEELISSANVCLINGDMERSAVISIIRTAKLARTPVILDPQIASERYSQGGADLPADYYSADILVPNFAEATELFNESGQNFHNAKLIGSDLLGRGVGCVIVKLGRRGVVVVDRAGADHIAAFDVKVVDHNGSGDAFNGALAACRAVTEPIREAVKFASAAGALACSKFGAQEALPRKEKIIEILQDLPR
ncbi:MAG: ribokinase [Anaerohalosphaeraceae bacterium]|nr:ribokinase [Anaerohalosphaeraceae bacterium]